MSRECPASVPRVPREYNSRTSQLMKNYFRAYSDIPYGKEIPYYGLLRYVTPLLRAYCVLYMMCFKGVCRSKLW